MRKKLLFMVAALALLLSSCADKSNTAAFAGSGIKISKRK